MSASPSPLDVIEIRGLEVRCVVGVYPRERVEPQPLRVDVSCWLDTRPAARGGGLTATVDYARLCGELRFLLESCRFELLETAADALAAYLLAPPTADLGRPPIREVSVRLEKPQALPGGALPSLRIHRTHDEFRPVVEEKPFGLVDVVHEGKGYGIYRLRIAPGRSIPTHVHRRMEEHELVLGRGLLLQGRPVAPGTAHAWPHELPHRYDNPTDGERTVLCVDRPPFQPDDEIEVPAPPGGLTLPAGVSYYPPEASR